MIDRLGAAACVLLAWSSAALAAAAGMDVIVTEVAGSARVEQRQLALLDGVRNGDRIELAAGARLVLFNLALAHQYRLSGPGRFAVQAGALALQAGAGSVHFDRRDPALSRAARTPPRVIAGAVVRAADGGGALERIAPSQAVFRWRARPHRGNWSFQVSDEAGKVVFETHVQGTSTELPACALQPDHAYLRELRWTGRDGAVQVDVASVRTLDEAEDAQLARLRPRDGAGAGERVLYALYLRGIGVPGLAAQVAPELDETGVND
ncbi:MAG: hypothetical protein ACXWVG_03790 [Telluria sp.]